MLQIESTQLETGLQRTETAEETSLRRTKTALEEELSNKLIRYHTTLKGWAATQATIQDLKDSLPGRLSKLEVSLVIKAAMLSGDGKTGGIIGQATTTVSGFYSILRSPPTAAAGN